MLLIQFNFFVLNVIQRIEDAIPAFQEEYFTNSKAFVVFCQLGSLKIKGRYLKRPRSMKAFPMMHEPLYVYIFLKIYIVYVPYICQYIYLFNAFVSCIMQFMLCGICESMN